MEPVVSSPAETSLARRRAMNEISDSMREMTVQIAVLGLKASEKVGLRDVDLKCFDILVRDGAMSASALARRLGLHPATMTGVLDRLEKGGWITRERDPDDRRAVLITPVRERVSEVFKLFLGVLGEMNEVMEGYDQRQLETVIDFVQHSTKAAQKAAAQMGDG
jgi:DNA-binding MarR family transcriptional regulator